MSHFKKRDQGANKPTQSSNSKPLSRQKPASHKGTTTSGPRSNQKKAFPHKGTTTSGPRSNQEKPSPHKGITTSGPRLNQEKPSPHKGTTTSGPRSNQEKPSPHKGITTSGPRSNQEKTSPRGGGTPFGRKSANKSPTYPRKGPASSDFRESRSSLVTIFGFNAIRAALEARPDDCQRILCSKSRKLSTEHLGLLKRARAIGLEVNPISEASLDDWDMRHQGLALEVKLKKEPTLEELLDNFPATDPALILVLDHLEDPQNFGALIRSAAVFGALGVVYPKDRAAPVSLSVVSAAAGATEVIPLVKVVNLARAVENLKSRGFWVVAAEAGQGEEASLFDFPERTALILGSEGAGLSALLAAQADLKTHIHLRSDVINSLNVSNAGAILMYRYQACLAAKANPALGLP